MIFNKKELPKPFESPLIERLKEFKELTKLDGSKNIKNFNLSNVFQYTKKNIDFLEFTNLGDRMERVNTIYNFLINFDNENNIIDNNLHLISLKKLYGDKLEINQFLNHKISSIPSEELKKILLEKYRSSFIPIRNENKNLKLLRKELEKEYREEHKLIAKILIKLRSHSK